MHCEASRARLLAMSWLDKAKVALGILDPEDIEADPPPRARRTAQQDGRPSLDHIDATPQKSLEDALQARERGDLAEMRKLLDEMDQGKGLRVVLRAAAALEAEDHDTLRMLLPKVAALDPPWRLLLQVAAALDDPTKRAPLVEQAMQLEAPSWSIAWTRCLSNDKDEQRQGLVELLFVDIALAQTVAARDLKIADVVANPKAAKRYASFTHGRDCVKRFGAPLVANLLEKI